jgi:thiol-disulfide isomerase/thioredoxin
MIGLGSFSIQTVLVAGCVFVAWAVARKVARMSADAPYKAAGGVLLDAAFWGFLAARLGYIALWWHEYSAAPMSMIAISDGGFTWWVGIPVAAAFVWWRTRSPKALRGPALAGIIGGIAVWAVANGVLSVMLRSAPPLPDLQLMTLDGRPVSLASYAGRPVVLNLWATWCPPCRREMPAFQQAQSGFPDVAFVLVNQGETADQAQRFLESEGLDLSDVLLDPDSVSMQALQSRGLPTTVFFDAQGRQVDTHLGEITMPSLKDKILRRFSDSLDPGTDSRTP